MHLGLGPGWELGRDEESRDESPNPVTVEGYLSFLAPFPLMRMNYLSHKNQAAVGPLHFHPITPWSRCHWNQQDFPNAKTTCIFIFFHLSVALEATNHNPLNSSFQVFY